LICYSSFTSEDRFNAEQKLCTFSVAVNYFCRRNDKRFRKFEGPENCTCVNHIASTEPIQVHNDDPFLELTEHLPSLGTFRELFTRNNFPEDVKDIMAFLADQGEQRGAVFCQSIGRDAVV
jgi:hypothetical protein